MFLSGKHADESTEHHQQTLLRLSRRQLRDRHLFPDDEFQFRNQIYNELAIRAQCFAKRFLPTAECGFALAEHAVYKALEGLREGRVRSIPIVLVKFSGCEKTPGWHQGLL